MIRLCSRASFYYGIEDAQEINDALVTKISVYIKLRQIEPPPFNEINEKGNKKRIRKQCTQTWRFELSSAGKIPHHSTSVIQPPKIPASIDCATLHTLLLHFHRRLECKSSSDERTTLIRPFL